LEAALQFLVKVSPTMDNIKNFLPRRLAVGSMLWHISLLDLDKFGPETWNRADSIIPEILERFDAKTLADISEVQLETFSREESIHIDSNLYKFLAHRRQLSRAGINFTYEVTYTPLQLGSPLEVIESPLETQKPPTPVLETLVSTINSNLPLSSKQKAWIQLKELAQTNEAAKQIVDAVLAKPFSKMAKEIARTLGKPDFLEVSREDLVSYVTDLKLCSSLVLELAGRFQI
jgi:hypothetical protein